MIRTVKKKFDVAVIYGGPGGFQQQSPQLEKVQRLFLWSAAQRSEVQQHQGWEYWGIWTAMDENL